MQVLLYVEHLNSFCFTEVRKDPDKKHLLKVYLDGQERRLTSLNPTFPWEQNSAIAKLLNQIERLPTINSDIIHDVTKVILNTQAMENDSQEETNPAKRVDETLIDNPFKLRLEKAYFMKGVERSYFSTKALTPYLSELVNPVESFRLNIGRVYSLDQILDPISVLQRFILKHLHSDDVEEANHYIQTWIKHQFKINYSSATKYILKEISNVFNQTFYGSKSPTITEIRNNRSEIIDTGLLVSIIRGVMAGKLSEAGQAKTEHIELSHAIGIYLFMRFCRLLRVRHLWPGTEDKLQGKTTEVQRTLEQNPSCSALRALEYSYFQSRVFGAIVAIPGLNFIFRGGIVPRTESGRAFVVEGPPGSGKTVLVLQRLAGIAARGGLSVYFSFEESRELINDRLVAFNFIDPSRFDVGEGGSDSLIEEIERRLQARSNRAAGFHKGLFWLYGEKDYESESRFQIKTVIQSLAKATGNRWRWKALAVDSVNALDFHNETPKFQGSSIQRVGLRNLIDTIEAGGFLGLVISEEDTLEYTKVERRSFLTLPYLADTLVRLSIDRETPTRWIEIQKCRSQNYHQGKHRFRISEGRGVKVYPSLSAIQSTLRRRGKSTISEHRLIPFPEKISEAEFAGVREKSCTVVFGPPGIGKTELLLNMATAPSIIQSQDGLSTPNVGPSLFVINFRTAESKFLQTMTRYQEVHNKWDRLSLRKVRWFSPGANIGPEEIIDSIWKTIEMARLDGRPFDRIIIDEIENASIFLPEIGRDHLFWTTLLELLSTEAITSFFGVADTPDNESRILQILLSNADYIFSSGGQPHTWKVVKSPPLSASPIKSAETTTNSS